MCEITLAKSAHKESPLLTVCAESKTAHLHDTHKVTQRARENRPLQISNFITLARNCPERSSIADLYVCVCDVYCSARI